MAEERIHRVLSLVILFLLATTLFNTLRANRVEQRTTAFRKEASFQLGMTKKTLEEQERINAGLEHTLDELLAAQPEAAGGN